MHQATQQRINQLADDVGRLKRRHPDDHTVDRIANHIEALHHLLTPSAAQLAARTAPGDETAITEAIRIVDQHHQRIRSRMRL